MKRDAQRKNFCGLRMGKRVYVYGGGADEVGGAERGGESVKVIKVHSVLNLKCTHNFLLGRTLMDTVRRDFAKSALLVSSHCARHLKFKTSFID